MFWRKKHLIKPVEETKEISLGETLLEYTLRKSFASKRMRVSINQSGEITVTAPMQASNSLINSFIVENAEWIKKHVAFYKKAPKNGRRALIEENKIRFLGKDYEVMALPAKGREEIKLIGEKAVMHLKKDCFENKERLLIKWYKKQAKKLIEEKVKKLLEKTTQEPVTIRMKTHKRLWGSCSSKRNLNFNWSLVMAPEIIIDYIIAHEVAHLIELNHSKKFWEIVEGLCPHYKECEQWLKLNGSYARF